MLSMWCTYCVSASFMVRQPSRDIMLSSKSSLLIEPRPDVELVVARRLSLDD